MKHTKLLLFGLLCTLLGGFFAVTAQDMFAQRAAARPRTAPVAPAAPKVTAPAVAKTAPAHAEESASVKEFPGASDQWRSSDSTAWMDAERMAHKIKPHFNNRAILKGDQKEGHTYGNYTEADLVLWQQETERLVLEGSRIFHSDELLGSTNGVSCDMCHPDGEGTHAETYPKYQVQLGRAALMQDMMNWCLENPCRGEPMSNDDPRMRAMEAYLWAQASGKVLKYGKH